MLPLLIFKLEDLLETKQNTWNKKFQKLEWDKTDLIDRKEKIFSHEIENIKLQFVEEKEQLKDNVNQLAKEKEQISEENQKLRDQNISERQTERKEAALQKEQTKEDKLEIIRGFENKMECLSEVKMEVDEQLRKQSVRLNDTLEENMKLKVGLKKTELKQSEMEMLLQQRDFDIKVSVSGLEQKLLKKEQEIFTKNDKLHSATKVIKITGLLLKRN